MARRTALAALTPLFVSALLWTACRPAVESGEYHAEIRRTDHRVAHIVAADLGSLGFGEGFAIAEDHLCSIADQVVRVRGERAKYFGPGEDDEHLRSDIGFKALDMRSDAPAELASQPQEIQDWVAGYVAGYNQYLRETGRDNVAGWCRGQEWVFEIEPADLYAYFRSIIHMSTGFVAMIATAEPPSAGGEPTAGGGMASFTTSRDLGGWDDREMKGASNGWALGHDRTESGHGMLIANPHYPWVGSNRFWEKHLTIPSQLDVYGVGLIGMPGVAIGFNEGVAWTHTVSAGERFTLYALDLVPGSPTTYRYDDEERQLTPRTVTVEVRQPDGTLASVEHTTWFSHYGPVVDFPGMAWSESRAVALRDTNEANDEAMGQWLDMDRATTMDAFQEVHRKWNGMPWINTMATSRDGRAWYADGSATPNLTREAIDLWKERRESDSLTKEAWKRGVVLLDGSDSRFEWQTDPEARDPGIVSFARSPQLERSDYIFNSNDSYWLANSSALLTGYSPMHGLEETPRTLRTRMNDTSLRDTSPDGPSGEDGRFSFAEMKAEILSDRSLTAELLLDELVARCRSKDRLRVDGETIELRAACDALAAYDGHLDLDSRGAVLFREWIGQYDISATFDAGDLFANPFDPADPVDTPNGLAAGPLALENLARAVKVLERAGLGVDATLRETQIAYRGGKKIPIHGGDGTREGVENFIRYGRNTTTLEPDLDFERIEGSPTLTSLGYPVNSGTSFIMALEFTDAGPHAEAFLTYSQSGDPTSPYFFDQTELFSRKAWRPILFDEAQIETATQSTLIVTGPRG